MSRAGRWGWLATSVVTACSGPSKDPTCDGAAAVKLSDLQTAIFTPSCALGACHSGAVPAENLSLVSGQTYAATVNVASVLDSSKLIIDPGNAQDSELYLQVANGLMPQTGGALSSDQQKQIHDWICVGAPNN